MVKLPMEPDWQGKYSQQTPTQQGASRHRAGHNAGLHPEDAPYLTNPGLPQSRRGRQTQAPTDDNVLVEEEEFYEEDKEDEVWPQHLTPMSAIRFDVDSNGDPLPGTYHQGDKTFRYHGDIPQRRSRHQQNPPGKQQRTRYEEDIDELETERPPKQRRRHLDWRVIFAVGMLFMLALFVLGTNVYSWVTTKLDDLHYNMPRTFQIDEVVGHNDSATSPSHFIALNLNRHVLVIELPGGDSSKARIYSVTTLFGNGEELTPITLTFQDVNGDGKPDMIIHIHDQKIVMINDNGSFRPLKPNEHVQL